MDCAEWRWRARSNGDIPVADPTLRRRRTHFWQGGGCDVRVRGKLGAARERLGRRFGNRRSLSAGCD